MEQWLAELWRLLRGRNVAKYAPKRVAPWIDSCREWAHRRRREKALRRALVETRLVPEQELERKYRDGLLLLSQERGPFVLGDYLEFGVFNGTSLVCMYRALKSLGIEHVRLFGFDSFEGLPAGAATDSGGEWSAGQFKIPYRLTKGILDRHGVDRDRVVLVKGWFSETLDRRLIDRHRIMKASVVMIDCDLYSSAKEALDFTGPLIREEAIVFFDDWHAGQLHEKCMGEKRAFDEFLVANPHFVWNELPDLRYNYNSKVFHVARQGRGV